MSKSGRGQRGAGASRRSGAAAESGARRSGERPAQGRSALYDVNLDPPRASMQNTPRAYDYAAGRGRGTAQSAPRAGLQERYPTAEPGRPSAPGRAPAKDSRAPAQNVGRAGNRRAAAQQDAGGDHAPVYDYQREPQAAGPETARSRAEKKRRRLTKAELRRRRLRRRIFAGAGILVIVGAGVLLTVLLLFKVTAFEVQNADGSTPADTGVYTEDQLIAALGVQKGDNLFSFRAGDKVAQLNAAFPLLEEIELRRRLPGTVILRVRPAVETYCIQTDAGWVILSERCKVISLSADQPDLPVIRAAAAAPQVGESLTLSDETAGQTLDTLLSALDGAGLLSGVTEFDVTDAEQITFLYQGCVRVQLGTTNSLDYKLKLAAYILLNAKGDGLSDTDTGTLDISNIRSDGTIEPTFARGDPAAASAAAGSESTPESAQSTSAAAPAA